MMIVQKIDLLSLSEWKFWEDYISKVDKVWWLEPETNLGYKTAPTAPACNTVNVEWKCGVRPKMMVEGMFDHCSKSEKITIFGLPWTILDMTGNKRKAVVLCDEVVAVRAYDKSSNDWEFSDLKKWLQEWCRYMCLGSENVAYGLNIAGISLLSEAQYEEYKCLIRPLNEEWWLQDAGDGFAHGPGPWDLVKTVDGKGNVRKFGSLVRNRFVVRPTACIELESGAVGPGDSICFLNWDWIVLHAYEGVNKLQIFVLSNNPLMCCQFDSKSNDFFTSELYAKLSRWCQTECEKIESINYKEE